MFINETQLKKINANIEANNAALKESKQTIPHEVIDRNTGEVLYVSQYVLEGWTIRKVRGARSAYYQIVKRLKNKLGKVVEIVLPLTDDDIETLRYYKSGELEPLFRSNQQDVSLKTRFMYGVTEYGNVYICVMVSIANKIMKHQFLADSKVDMIMDSMSDENTTFNIMFEYKLPKEEVNLEELESI